MKTLDLFKGLDGDIEPEEANPPKTQGVKYAGSKLKLLSQILELAKEVPAKTVFDGFAGTTRVSQAFSQRGYSVTSNDTAVWSKVFGTCYLLGKESDIEHYGELVRYLNSIPPVDGWFSENYGGEDNGGSAVQPDGLKKPWQRKNTRKLDAIRLEIDRLELSEIEKAVAITSLILAMDKVDSTLGHYVSYLKDWSPRSYNDVKLEVPAICPGTGQHSVLNEDVFVAARRTQADVAYLDPPYGSNNEKMPPSRVRYNAYYHPWKSICLFDRPETFGKAKRRSDTSDRCMMSPFEEFKKNNSGKFIAVDAVERLIEQCECPWMILSYSSGGRATSEELHSAIENNGKVLRLVELDHKKNVMANMKWTNEWLRDAHLPNREFLFLIEKR